MKVKKYGHCNFKVDFDSKIVDLNSNCDNKGYIDFLALFIKTIGTDSESITEIIAQLILSLSPTEESNNIFKNFSIN